MTTFLLILSVLFVLPALFFVLECLASILYREPKYSAAENKSSVILIPAHNEERNIQETLDSLNKQLGDEDSILVVADNCNDSTANLARKLGATVVERFNEEDRGKGFALAHGLDQLRKNPPDFVIIVDADCIVLDGAIEKLKNSAVYHQLPTQSRYSILANQNASLASKISELAFLIKTRIRTRGLRVLGAPTPLLGTGMAFPWDDITRVSLASGEIVEDMKLGVELASMSRGAVYVDSAVVTSKFPDTEEGLKSQRERWEHGHIDILRRFVGPLFKTAFRKLNLPMAIFTMDLAVPPLTLLLAIQLVIFLGLALVSYVFGSAIPVFVAGLSIALMLSALLCSWYIYGRQIIPVSEFVRMPGYIFSKLGIYIGYLTNRQTKWIRTTRDENDSDQK